MEFDENFAAYLIGLRMRIKFFRTITHNFILLSPVLLLISVANLIHLSFANDLIGFNLTSDNQSDQNQFDPYYHHYSALNDSYPSLMLSSFSASTSTSSSSSSSSSSLSSYSYESFRSKLMTTTVQPDTNKSSLLFSSPTSSPQSLNCENDCDKSLAKNNHSILDINNNDGNNDNNHTDNFTRNYYLNKTNLFTRVVNQSDRKNGGFENDFKSNENNQINSSLIDSKHSIGFDDSNSSRIVDSSTFLQQNQVRLNRQHHQHRSYRISINEIILIRL
ncbi:hypothetical protein SSS_02374 [Sarcoptes scabiei]|uniref:Uncharacterized protein n=1 Tax=Sarcoptes scabiei TaxID=52283 RepID=A0A834R0V9_SARSC|nr:hypothetical protein SSS_02374 [Sarcoptes scabiei]